MPVVAITVQGDVFFWLKIKGSVESVWGKDVTILFWYHRLLLGVAKENTVLVNVFLCER